MYSPLYDHLPMTFVFTQDKGESIHFASAFPSEFPIYALPAGRLPTYNLSMWWITASWFWFRVVASKVGMPKESFFSIFSTGMIPDPETESHLISHHKKRWCHRVHSVCSYQKLAFFQPQDPPPKANHA